MNKIKLSNILLCSAFIISFLIGLNPIKASALWKIDSTGWCYTEGNSNVIGWKQIDGFWYYFYENGYMAKDTTINGSYLNSQGIWIDSIETFIRAELIKNISIQNTNFSIQCSNNDVKFENIGNIVKNEIEKLKITNSYEMFNIKDYDITIKSYGQGKISIDVKINYRMSASEENELTAKANEIVSSITTDNMSDEEKELAIHDWIVNNTTYDRSLSIYDPYNTLTKHTGVCEGYALLAQKMFTLAGIKSMVVEGTAKGESHAWNLVYIDNKWRHVDCTWDDPISSYGDIIRHNYFNLTDKEIIKDHTWNTTSYPSAN